MTPGTVAGLALSLLGGAAAGWLCFAGLWGTVRRMGGARRPTALYAASLAVRLSLVALAFILAARVGLGSLLLCLLGFIAARLYVQTRLRESR